MFQLDRKPKREAETLESDGSSEGEDDEGLEHSGSAAPKFDEEELNKLIFLKLKICGSSDHKMKSRGVKMELLEKKPASSEWLRQ